MTGGPDDVVAAAAVLVAVAGVAVSAILLAAHRGVSPALPTLLDFLMAAGLLRLTTDPGWGAIATAACVLAIRKTAMVGIRRAERGRRHSAGWA